MVDAAWSEWASGVLAFAVDYLYGDRLLALVPRVNANQRILRRLAARDARLARLIDVVLHTPFQEYAGCSRVIDAHYALIARQNANLDERTALRGRIGALRAEMRALGRAFTAATSLNRQVHGNASMRVRPL